MIGKIRQLVQITRSGDIIRRYFVVNGFDGALTMLGMITGFRLSGEDEIAVMLSVCVGAAVALGVSGITSAYISESAERRKDLHDLELAMGTDLEASAHGMASRLIPPLIALVNGLAPLLLSVIILAPLWLHSLGWAPLSAPLDMAIALAFILIFLLGVFLGRVGGVFWLWSGIKMVLIAALTVVIIVMLEA